MADRRLAVSLRQSTPIPLDVKFTCGTGDVLAVFGPSGSGKTTILRSIAGLYRPEQGSVQCGSENWTDSTTGRFAPPHARAVGYVFQEYALFPHLTAAGNVITALGHRRPAERRARAEALLKMVHLSEHFDRRPHQLSGGERQRVALARALAREPAVLLLDEPFAAVDRSVRRMLQDEIDGLQRTLDIPIILVTHDFDDVVRLATHVLILERGHSVAWGPLPELMSRPDLAWLREAVGLGSVFNGTVVRSNHSDGLVEVAFDGGVLIASAHAAAPGARVRVRIPAREIVLATRRPDGISLHNALPATVAAIHRDPAFKHAMVQMAVGGVLLLAEITNDAVERLGISVGMQLYALIKSVSIDLLVSSSNRTLDT